MKKSTLIMGILLFLFTGVSYAQRPPITNFNKSEKKELQSVLGKDFTAVFKGGALIIARPSSVKDIKISRRSPTGFKNPGNVADWVAVKKEWWVVKGAGDMLVKQLGQERFKALKNILAKKNIDLR